MGQSVTSDNIVFVALALIGLYIVSFLLGSIPWGVIISKLFFKKDLRDEGSGNIGATNAMRSMGKKGGIPVFLLDFFKGLVAGYVGYLVGGILHEHFGTDPTSAYGIALMGCAMGHIFSPWLGWKGGKGITVAFGCMFFSFGPIGALLVLAAFLLVVIITKRISCGSIAGAVADILLSFYYFGFGSPYGFDWMAIAAASIVGLIVIWAHRENIKRIIDGTEPKIGGKK